ncbi:FmdB family zinc ribbon protein [Agrococcus carbonis]|uniref:Putative regulatory protein, FmdB family n=1 Tax=Agrococcus carbonis TaxID=684552 RepID=A0A1H1RDB2_9MICO|nr:FmdB family zinc ribbon protein [Agrococcus carbonis]SDS33744.1 putative regulatory protein, FmdB family [Agrococcus carbonis]
MPVYAYACTACGHAFDARQGFDEPALTVCDACGGALRKQYGTVGVTFNGSGFYRTDSRSASGAGSASAPAASGSQPAAKSSTTSGGGATA